MKKKTFLVLGVIASCAALLFGVFSLPHLSAHAASASTYQQQQAAKNNLISVDVSDVSNYNSLSNCASISTEVMCQVTLTVHNVTQNTIRWSSSSSATYCAYNKCSKGSFGGTYPGSGTLTKSSASMAVYILFPNEISSHASLTGTITFQGPSNSVQVKYASTYFY